MQQNVSPRLFYLTGRYVQITMVIGCLGFYGCVATQSQGDFTGTDQAATSGTNRDGTGEIEVVEEKYPDGTVNNRVEGKRDANGNFIRHGLLTNYYNTGEKLSEMSFIDGVRHGPKTAWYRDGQIWNYGEFVNGKADGTWTEWLSNGVKGRETHFDNGAFHGLITEWYPNGQKKMEIMYLKGQKQGRMTIWDRDGNVVRHVDYVDDVEQP